MPKYPVLVRRERLHDQITRYIATGLLQGEITGKEPWISSESELGRHLGVSRSVLRESIKVLAAKGLVEVQPKTGLRVRPRTDWNLFDPDLLEWQQETGPDEVFLRDLSEVRLTVEPAAAAFAAIRASDEEIESLFSYYQQMVAGVKDRETYMTADTSFHSAIIAACHNALLMQLNTTITNAFRRANRSIPYRRETTEKSLSLHKKVADAIKARNQEEARSATEKLVHLGTQHLYEGLKLKKHKL